MRTTKNPKRPKSSNNPKLWAAYKKAQTIEDTLKALHGLVQTFAYDHDHLKHPEGVRVLAAVQDTFCERWEEVSELVLPWLQDLFENAERGADFDLAAGSADDVYQIRSVRLSRAGTTARANQVYRLLFTADWVLDGVLGSIVFEEIEPVRKAIRSFQDLPPDFVNGAETHPDQKR